jgi:hypothetical protein
VHSPRATFGKHRFYDFVVFSEKKRVEKLRYMHRNPVARRLVLTRNSGTGAAIATTPAANAAPCWSTKRRKPTCGFAGSHDQLAGKK